MALNIKNQDVEKLVEEVVQMTGESKTEAVGRALEERRQRLSVRQLSPKNQAHFLAFLQDEIWAQIPEQLLGTSLKKEEEENILGGHLLMPDHANAQA